MLSFTSCFIITTLVNLFLQHRSVSLPSSPEHPGSLYLSCLGSYSHSRTDDWDQEEGPCSLVGIQQGPSLQLGGQSHLKYMEVCAVCQINSASCCREADRQISKWTQDINSTNRAVRLTVRKPQYRLRSGKWHLSRDLNGSVQSSCSVVSDSLRLHGLQHVRPPCPSPTPGVYLYSCLLSL